MKDQISYKRYVAYFDMLGMKTAVYRDLFKAWEALGTIDNAREQIYRYSFDLKDINKTVVLQDRLKYFIFSDTIIAFTYKDEIEDLWAILFFSIEIFCQCLHRCIPLRGGISFGDFLFNLDKNFFLGRPLIEAHAISEPAQWLGIILSDYVASQCIANNIQGDDKEPIVVDWDVEQKDSSIQKRSVINWSATHKNNFIDKPPITAPQFYEAFEGLFGEYAKLRDKDKRKHINTVKFINSMYKNV